GCLARAWWGTRGRGIECRGGADEQRQAQIVTSTGRAAAPALIIVGWMMCGIISAREEVMADGRIIRSRGVDFSDIEIGLPVLAAMVMMPLTFNITNGIGAGFVV
ncbi:MAG TPA: hypothetical protein VMM78_07375, partial [Thermomicrobiales bacterium]|nr:hypothetical protein [Thermomicrobiales bacterium]